MCLTSRKFLTRPYSLIAWQKNQQYKSSSLQIYIYHWKSHNLRIYPAESVFGGEMRETADKESAIRIAGNFWVAEGVICKIAEHDFNLTEKP